MKFMRLIAMLTAVVLCLAACAAKEEAPKTEATPAPSADTAPEATAAADTSGVPANEAFMIKSLAMPYESWMTEEMYSMFAATFFVDMAYVDAFEINRLNTELGVPAVYVGELKGDNYGNGMNLVMFYTDAESGEITMVNATVYLKTGMFDGYCTENAGDPAAIMEGFVNDGVLQVYHEISAEEFMTAYYSLNQILNGAMSVE